jgi:mono/diheme cytochrome c family protein
MNKEVNYVLQGFLLTILFIGAFMFARYLYSLPTHKDTVTGPIATTDSQKGDIGSARGDGKMLFQDNCASCHSIIKDLTGPALGGVEDRIKDKKLLYAWIRNSQAVLKTGNPYFKDLVKRYDNVIMTSFSNLSDEEIAAILHYIKGRSRETTVYVQELSD